jgi:serine/threonine protein kinase/Flp pilus assembly protein TadD
MASEEQTVEQLFGDVLDCRPEDRCAFLDRACKGAPELRHRVEDLLFADGQAGSFLETPPLPRPANPTGTANIPRTNGVRVSPDPFDRCAASRFEPGQVIADRFTVIRYIARGGMGEVYEVADRLLQDVRVALKIILPEIAGDAGSSRRFEQEVLLARKVTHPNLCPIYDIARYDDPPPPLLFLTMKLLAGETLSSRLRQPEPIRREEAIAIVRQMVAGLGAIHAAGVIHRDIKPNNVMLDKSRSDLRLTIMDFGLAKLHESDETMGHSLVAGTPGYMAPEILLGPSQATDLFSLGVLLHEVLVGERPRVGAVNRAAEPSPALDMADIAPEFISAVKELLSIDPNRRSIAFNQLHSSLISSRPFESWPSRGVANHSASRLLSRRQFALGSALVACSAAGAVVWKWDNLYDLLHPLPARRFVALLNWPPTSDIRIKPMVAGAIDAIGKELERAEAFDRDLYIVSPIFDPGSKTTAELNDLRDRLGANLVLAASGVPSSGKLDLTLRLLDPSSTRALREKRITLPFDQQISLPAKAARVASELLGISSYEQVGVPDTQSSEAYATFQEAETLMKQPNDSGLNAAIDKYKQAVELDPRYASAYAKLALAYCRLYGLHCDPAALSLARANCDKALTLNPNSIEAHLALSAVLVKTGEMEGASREIEKALALDPVNPRTLVYQGQLYRQLDRWPEAEEALGRVTDLRPNYWFGHNELGVAYTLQCKYTQAMKEFRLASLASPKGSLPLNNIGDVYLRQGKLTEAEDAASRSSALQPNDLAAITLAAAYRCEGKYSEALRTARSAVDLNPAQSAGWLELGDCYSLVHGRSEAQKAYSQAAATQQEQLLTNPIDGPGWMLLALCRVKSGAPQTAPALIDNAAKYPSDDIDSQLFKARTLELLGKRDEALTVVVACLKRGATAFQIQSMTDMGPLRSDRRYQEILSSIASTTQAHF